jgi:hypothetical protein
LINEALHVMTLPPASSSRYALAIALLAALAPGANGQAKIPPSQLATVSQMIGRTHVAITYRRPVARGRALFGALVPYGRRWTPSADSAARIETTGPLRVAGTVLPAGVYSIWAVPDSAEWVVSFNARAELFHKIVPVTGDVASVRVRPTQGDYVETLMFSFPMVDADSARLELHWGATIIPIPITAIQP